MSLIDKLDLVVDRREGLNKSLSDGADKLLARYDHVAARSEAAFDKHHGRLDAESAAIDKTEAAIERLSNSAGNSQGSGTSPEPPETSEPA